MLTNHSGPLEAQGFPDGPQRRRQETERKIAEYERLLTQSQGQEKEVRKELLRLEREPDATRKELASLQSQLQVTGQQLAQTTAELERTQKKLEWRTDLMARRPRALYESGPVSYLEVLPGATSSSDFLTRVEFLQPSRPRISKSWSAYRTCATR